MKRKKSDQPSRAIRLVNSAETLTLRQVKFLILETGNQSDLILRLKPSQEVQAFLVLLKQALPTIR